MIVIDSKRQSLGRALDPKSALSIGELQCDNLPVLLQFESSFDFNLESMQAAAKKFSDVSGSNSVRMSQATSFVFEYLLETAFVGGSSDGEALQFHVLGHGGYGVVFDRDSLEVVEGQLPAPTGHVVVSEQAVGGMALFKAMLASAEARQSRTQIDGAQAESSIGQELSDSQLALVAGGKGSDSGCISDSGCGGDILVCGGDTSGCGGDILVVGCPDDYCAGDACYADYGCNDNICAGDACGVDAGCAEAGCIADACGGATCGGNACGQATCAGDACAGDACYWDACGSAACGAAACGGNYCPTDYCGADACGLDTPIDVCTADVCVIDFNPF